MLQVLEETRFLWAVTDTLLYFASNEGAEPLPNFEEALVQEIAQATVEHISGSYNKIISFPHTRFNNGWQALHNAAMSEIWGKSFHVAERLSSSLSSVLEDVTTWKSEHSHGESWWETPLRYYLSSMQNSPVRSTFCLSVPFVKKVRDRFGAGLGDLYQCREIGLKMQKYVRNDIEFISGAFSY